MKEEYQNQPGEVDVHGYNQRMVHILWLLNLAFTNFVHSVTKVGKWQP